MTRIYRYILADDDGYAPCVDNGLLTLATCKPVIRRMARIGDWVVGYMPKALGEGLIAWAGKVELKLDPFDYQREWTGRKDAAYYNGPCGNPERVDPQYHPTDEQMFRDLSADALIFDTASTWYFGVEPRQPPVHLDALKPAGQGHRVNFRLNNDLAQLENWLKSISPPGILSKPRSIISDGCGSGCGSARETAHHSAKGGC